jgi:hypothetical protein
MGIEPFDHACADGRKKIGPRHYKEFLRGFGQLTTEQYALDDEKKNEEFDHGAEL